MSDMTCWILISPLAKMAYFGDYLEVAMAELGLFLNADSQVVRFGEMEFIEIQVEAEQVAHTCSNLSRLSFVQGIFQRSGEVLTPINVEPGFCYPEELVFGQKYQGKTNELVTQLAINVGLSFLNLTATNNINLLDPMAGRGTTLLWAARYGMDSRGIEIDRKSADLFYSHVKKQCKLQKLKHKATSGQVGKNTKKKAGMFNRFSLGNESMMMVHGDSRNARELSQGKHFDLLVTDMPYGVQHLAGGSRNALETMKACAPEWIACMKKGGIAVLIHNRNQPKTRDLAGLFITGGLTHIEIDFPHRMSESIVRDLLVLQK
jgi:hypothetical protein